MKKLIIRIWKSPTLMTWGSFFSRSLSLIIVLPLVLTRLDTAEIALWYLFSTIISLQLLADLGFSPTFSRVIAFAMGGANEYELDDYRTEKNIRIKKNQPNWETIDKIYATSKVIYFRLSILSTFFLLVLGILALIRPISEIESQEIGWIAWAVIIFCSYISLRWNIYSAFLQGINEIALLRRWEMFMSLGSITCSGLVLYYKGGLLGLVIAHQSWVVLRILCNRLLCGHVQNSKFKEFKCRGIIKPIFNSVWPSAWRSGIGVMMSRGVIQLTGVIYAQAGTTSNVATYLLSLRLLNAMSGFSRAPFYSKIPLLSRLRAQGDIKNLIGRAKLGMKLSYWTFAIGFVLLGTFGNPLLIRIGSNADFANPILWGLLGFGFFIERYGAMHIQLYSTTNHIIWHIANGITGIILITISMILFPIINVYAFPVGIITAYLGFYSWYSAKHSYKSINQNFWAFEKNTMIPSFLATILFIVTSIFFYL